jgi:hypothetical protein
MRSIYVSESSKFFFLTTNDSSNTCTFRQTFYKQENEVSQYFLMNLTEYQSKAFLFYICKYQTILSSEKLTRENCSYSRSIAKYC